MVVDLTWNDNQDFIFFGEKNIRFGEISFLNVLLCKIVKSVSKLTLSKKK